MPSQEGDEEQGGEEMEAEFEPPIDEGQEEAGSEEEEEEEGEGVGKGGKGEGGGGRMAAVDERNLILAGVDPRILLETTEQQREQGQAQGQGLEQEQERERGQQEGQLQGEGGLPPQQQEQQQRQQQQETGQQGQEQDSCIDKGEADDLFAQLKHDRSFRVSLLRDAGSV